VLMASCALPGLLPPVRLADGHQHVDGGIVCGVPLAPAVAGDAELILVSDVGMDPVTGRAGTCAALPNPSTACGLSVRREQAYRPPVETAPTRVLDVVLRSFTVSRAVANRAAVRDELTDPRVRVLPHVADAWAAGLLPVLPTGPRDFARTGELVEAGRAATAAWLAGGGLDASPAEPDEISR
jgi:predicted acylesterase/phospholipase RssA